MYFHIRLQLIKLSVMNICLSSKDLHCVCFEQALPKQSIFYNVTTVQYSERQSHKLNLDSHEIILSVRINLVIVSF